MVLKSVDSKDGDTFTVGLERTSQFEIHVGFITRLHVDIHLPVLYFSMLTVRNMLGGRNDR